MRKQNKVIKIDFSKLSSTFFVRYAPCSSNVGFNVFNEDMKWMNKWGIDYMGVEGGLCF